MGQFPGILYYWHSAKANTRKGTACGERAQVVGGAAMLGGVTRMTISITVLAMEGTAALQLIVPLMLAVFVAKARPLRRTPCTLPPVAIDTQADQSCRVVQANGPAVVLI